MQGNIDFTGSLTGSIAGSGGGGSTVTITPTLESGTKIADYTIDSESGYLYAPTPPQGGVLDVQVNNTQVPNYESVVENSIAKIDLYPYLEKSEAYTIIDLINDEIELVDGKVGNLEQIVPYKQDKLIAGNNINIDANNVISASGGSSWDYSTSEVNTGQKWIDGKDIYCKVINNITISGTSTTVSISNVDKLIKFDGYLISSDSNYSIPIASYWETTSYHNSTYYDYLNSRAVIVHTTQTASAYPNGVLIAYYTKAS